MEHSTQREKIQLYVVYIKINYVILPILGIFHIFTKNQAFNSLNFFLITMWFYVDE